MRGEGASRGAHAIRHHTKTPSPTCATCVYSNPPAQRLGQQAGRAHDAPAKWRGCPGRSKDPMEYHGTCRNTFSHTCGEGRGKGPPLPVRKWPHNRVSGALTHALGRRYSNHARRCTAPTCAAPAPAGWTRPRCARRGCGRRPAAATAGSTAAAGGWSSAPARCGPAARGWGWGGTGLLTTLAKRGWCGPYALNPLGGNFGCPTAILGTRLTNRFGWTRLKYKYFALTVTDRFGPTVGWKQLKASAIKKSSWGDRQVERIKVAAALASRGAPLRPGAALASRGAGDALRGAGKLCERCEP